MLIRAIALSVALLVGLGTLVPLATEYAEAGSKKTRKYKKKKREWTGVKKYSKRWWQLYRAQERRKRQVAARKRALRLRQMRLAKAREASVNNAQAKASSPTPAKKPTAVLPSGKTAPQNWSPAAANSGEVSFKVAGNQGMEVGSASISVVGPATGESVSTGRNRTVGGVSTQALRRDVINQMIRENGWVVNDFQKEIGGKAVYVVVAQSQSSSGSVQSRLFYFTEADGRIYSVATNSNSDAAEKLAEESEKVVNSLQRGRRTQQAAARD